MDNLELARRCYDLRMDVVRMIREGKGGHIGGDMSIMETMAVLYLDEMNVDPSRADDPDRDRFVLSKGHCVETYYAVLAAKGFLDIEEVIRKYSKFASPYIGHPNNKLPGIEMNSGSLGHGLPVGVGMALAGKMDKRDYRVYVVLGDGELAEGSNWEAAMAGRQFGLDNLCAVVDRNRLQISGNTEDVMGEDDLEARFASFGWHVIQADGNSVPAMKAAFAEARRTTGKPTFIIANTTKGKGSSVMENKASWHHHVPDEEEYETIMRDLAAAKEAIHE